MEYQYEIQSRVEALAQIAMTFNSETSSFLLDEIYFSLWDRGPFNGSNFWLAKVIVKAGNKNEAFDCFNKKMARVIPQIAFISQCYTEFACQPFLVKRLDKSFAFFRYVQESEGVGLMFGDREKKALEILLIDKVIPGAFYSYWNDAVNTFGYSSKILLLCAALDALGKAGLSREDKKYKEKFYQKIEEIIGLELKQDLWGTKVDPNSGLRQRLVHGDYLGQDDVEKNYADLLHKRIIKYFNETILKEKLLEEDVVDPLRNILGHKEAYQNYIRSKGNKSLDLREVLSELEKVGINYLEDYEWMDNTKLTENY
ncbi:hypothetical protein [uncultured Nitrospira sp.]|uniref:hypothetical protein n=1 Tax=uncultured Nitrospira sp. TaxID=157176 RepID=UPI0031407409